MLPFLIGSTRDSRIASRMKYPKAMTANPEPSTLCELRLRMRMPDTGNDKLRKPARPTLDVLKRQPTTSPPTTTTPTTTPVTQTTRNLMGNPTKDNNNPVDKPLDPLPKPTCLAS
jgi:hypothetical protein